MGISNILIDHKYLNICATHRPQSALTERHKDVFMCYTVVDEEILREGNIDEVYHKTAFGETIEEAIINFLETHKDYVKGRAKQDK